MSSAPRTVAVVTGSRSDFGLLRPVMRAIAAHAGLRLRVIVAGAHLLPPARTADEVAAEFDVDAHIRMQREGERGRAGYAVALGRGVAGFAAEFAARPPDVLLVLGDRIDPFAAAAAAAAAGIHVAHLHGGDRAEGVADESWRHAITKLAHIHLPATHSSAERIVRMGEDPRRVHVVGSPAIDELADLVPLPDDRYDALGRPSVLFLMHPSRGEAGWERERAAEALRACMQTAPTLAIHPCQDPGREGIAQAIDDSGCRQVAHLPRSEFVGLLRRLRAIVGNSSAGLIECAAVPLRCINLGDRQGGRDKPANVIDLPDWSGAALEELLRGLSPRPLAPFPHPYGDGRAGERVADLLGACDLERYPLRKVNAY